MPRGSHQARWNKRSIEEIEYKREIRDYTLLNIYNELLMLHEECIECKSYTGSYRHNYIDTKNLLMLSVHMITGDSMSIKITVRIPLELKKRMEMYSDVNWSEVIRKAIEEKLRELEVKEALKIMDEIASKAKPGESLTDVIRRFRDERR
ncbi:MAG: hypothetical protein QXQ57_04490 [Sulfolobales archaeon]